MNLIKIENRDGKLLVSSRVVAEELGKRHDIVLRDIREKLDSHEFVESSYKNSQNKSQPEYLLTKDSFILLVMNYEGYNDFKRAYIQKFNEMEKELSNKTPKLPTTYLEALEQLVEKEKKILEMKPKVEYHDEVLDTDSEITTTVIAKELGMSAVSLNKILEENRIQYKQGKVWVLYKKYQNEGYTKIRTTLVDDKTYHSTVWTEKGREFIHGVVKHLNKYV